PPPPPGRGRGPRLPYALRGRPRRPPDRRVDPPPGGGPHAGVAPPTDPRGRRRGTDGPVAVPLLPLARVRGGRQRPRGSRRGIPVRTGPAACGPRSRRRRRVRPDVRLGRRPPGDRRDETEGARVRH